jgi:hypothetical protein
MIPGGELRALTVQQPHASAIVHGHKDVENRSRPFPLPDGTVIAIHAGMKDDPAGLRVPVELPDELPHGAIIGLVRVANCIRCGRCPGYGSEEHFRSSWAAPGHWHWILEGAYPLPAPVPCRGQLSLFRPPAHIAAAVLDQLGPYDPRD